MSVIREIEADDFDRGYLDLIKELSKYDYPCTKEAFSKYIQDNKHVIIVVAEKNNKIIGAASLFILNKVHCNPIGQIEDVVVTSSLRGQGIGKLLINYLVQVSKSYGCYKTVLNSLPHNIPFYEKCNFSSVAFQLVYHYE